MTSNIQGATVIKNSTGLTARENVESDGLGSINTTAHLNRSKVKQTALEMAKLHRPANKFSRVSMSFLERVEANTRAFIASAVKCHPSTGKTLM